ncbi:MAG: NAD-dependent epimerase/dehydratase family protein, partial [Nanoarchaeota archaeon]
NILDFKQFSDKLDELQPELILHLAGVPLANVAVVDANIAIDNILIGTLNMLNVIKDKKYVKRFVYTSSSMTYGNFVKIPADESHPQNPLCNYGTTKLAGEVLVRGFSNRYGFEHVVIRPSAVYGPGDTNNRVVQIFVENALRGMPLTVEGSSDSRLDFSYVEDVADGFCLALLNPNAKNETFNLTNGQGRTLQELVDIIKVHVPEVKILQAPPLPFRPLRGALDISKAKKLLGYNPKHSLELGIDKYIQHLRANGITKE